MKQLIALVPILYLTKYYKAGEEIPASDPDMVKAWLENNAAAWREKSKPFLQKNTFTEGLKAYLQSKEKDTENALPDQTEDEPENESKDTAAEEKEVSTPPAEETDKESAEPADSKEENVAVEAANEGKQDTPQQSITRRNKK